MQSDSLGDSALSPTVLNITKQHCCVLQMPTRESMSITVLKKLIYKAVLGLLRNTRLKANKISNLGFSPEKKRVLQLKVRKCKT